MMGVYLGSYVESLLEVVWKDLAPKLNVEGWGEEQNQYDTYFGLTIYKNMGAINVSTPCPPANDQQKQTCISTSWKHGLFHTMENHGYLTERC